MRTHVFETLKHKAWVFRFMFGFAVRLLWRAVVHDNSKLGPIERAIFASVSPSLKNSTYGGAEYRANLSRLGPALEAHYRSNSHHPEHYAQGLRGMDLLDVVELVCDWRAAVKRHRDGNIHRSLELNRQRFKISDQLGCVLHNSVKEKK